MREIIWSLSDKISTVVTSADVNINSILIIDRVKNRMEQDLKAYHQFLEKLSDTPAIANHNNLDEYFQVQELIRTQSLNKQYPESSWSSQVSSILSNAWLQTRTLSSS